MTQENALQSENDKTLPNLKAQWKVLRPDLNLDRVIEENWVHVGEEDAKRFGVKDYAINYGAATLVAVAGAFTHNMPMLWAGAGMMAVRIATSLYDHVRQKPIYEMASAATMEYVSSMKQASTETCATAAPASQRPASTPSNMPADSKPFDRR